MTAMFARIGLVLAAVTAFSVAFARADAPASKPATRLEVAVTRAGFEPDPIHVPAKTPVTLVFTRKTDKTCARTIVINVEKGKTIERELPLDKPVEIVATFPNAGTLGYACGMDMTRGTIIVQ